MNMMMKRSISAKWRDFHADNGGSLEDLVTFVRVSSEFYPDLQRYYDHEAAQWLADRQAEDDDSGSD
jgi:hypothetical protein